MPVVSRFRIQYRHFCSGSLFGGFFCAHMIHSHDLSLLSSCDSVVSYHLPFSVGFLLSIILLPFCSRSWPSHSFICSWHGPSGPFVAWINAVSHHIHYAHSYKIGHHISHITCIYRWKCRAVAHLRPVKFVGCVARAWSRLKGHVCIRAANDAALSATFICLAVFVYVLLKWSSRVTLCFQLCKHRRQQYRRSFHVSIKSSSSIVYRPFRSLFVCEGARERLSSSQTH